MIILKHSNSGVIKKAPTGFSWTALFFGGLVPLFRGDVMWFIISLLVSICSFGIFWLIFPFIYNKIYIKKALEKGYVPADQKAESYLRYKGLIR